MFQISEESEQLNTHVLVKAHKYTYVFIKAYFDTYVLEKVWCQISSVHSFNRDGEINVLYFEALAFLSFVINKFLLRKSKHKIDWSNFFCFLRPQYPFDTVNLRNITLKNLLIGKYPILFGMIFWVLRGPVWGVHQKRKRTVNMECVLRLKWQSSRNIFSLRIKKSPTVVKKYRFSWNFIICDDFHTHFKHSPSFQKAPSASCAPS